MLKMTGSAEKIILYREDWSVLRAIEQKSTVEVYWTGAPCVLVRFSAPEKMVLMGAYVEIGWAKNSSVWVDVTEPAND